MCGSGPGPQKSEWTEEMWQEGWALELPGYQCKAKPAMHFLFQPLKNKKICTYCFLNLSPLDDLVKLHFRKPTRKATSSIRSSSSPSPQWFFQPLDSKRKLPLTEHIFHSAWYLLLYKIISFLDKSLLIHYHHRLFLSILSATHCKISMVLGLAQILKW